MIEELTSAGYLETSSRPAGASPMPSKSLPIPTLPNSVRRIMPIDERIQMLNVLLLASYLRNVFDMVSDPLHISLSRRGDEVRGEVDHDDCVRLVRACPNEFENIIGHIPWYIEHPSRGRVAPDNRGLRELQGLLRGVVRGVAQVNKHSDTVHLLDERASERAQTAMQRLRGGEDAAGVGEGVVAHVCERHIAHSQVIVLAEGSDRVAELVRSMRASVWTCQMSARPNVPFHPEVRRNLASADGNFDLLCAESPGESLHVCVL